MRQPNLRQYPKLELAGGSGSFLDTILLRPLSLNSAFRAVYVSEQASAAWAASGEVPMFIEIQELQIHPIDFEEDVRPGVIDFGLELKQQGALRGVGRAQLVEEHHGKHQIIQDIRLTGDLSARFELMCARCLEPVVQDVTRKFDLLYRPLGADAGREELSVTTAEAEISYYQGEGLLLEDALREQVLLAVPVKVICREDCKGLCPHCGKNLNQEQCSCAEPMEDPRWSALKEIRSKLEN